MLEDTRRASLCGQQVRWPWVGLWLGVLACTDVRSSAKTEPPRAARAASHPRVDMAPGGSHTGGSSIKDPAPRDSGVAGDGRDASTWPRDAASADVSDGSVASKLDRVMLISVDGLGANHLVTQFGRGKLPGFAALRAKGSSTLNARTDYAYTVTLPNHTSMLTGRPVTRDPDLPDDVFHGWTGNGLVDFAYTLHNAGNPKLKYVASIFDVAHDHGKRTCMYSGKAKFSLYSNSYSANNGAPDTEGADNGRNKLDRVVILENATATLISTIEGDLANGACDLAFIHIADLDWLGHSSAWASEAWYAGLDRVDEWVTRLAKFTDASDAGTAWGLVLTADHGGLPEGHSDPTDRWNYQIPFFVIGPQFTPGADLYGLVSAARVDPGRERPPYSAPRQPIRNADAANVVMGLLGLPPVPGSFLRDLLPPR